MPRDTSIIHLFHQFFATFFVKEADFLLIFGKDEETTGIFIETMEYMKVLVVMLVFEKASYCIKVMSSSCMYGQTWRFVDDQIVI